VIHAHELSTGSAEEWATEGGSMLITTTPSVEGKVIAEYHGLVSGEAIMGANVFRDLFAGVRDIVGGRSAAYERELKKAKEIALAEMAQQAEELGGDAVISVDLDYETIGEGSMLMVSASGTAVRLGESPRGTAPPLVDRV
jgi:uncharacterized protein YbjQ (UPF0145 family)